MEARAEHWAPKVCTHTQRHATTGTINRFWSAWKFTGYYLRYTAIDCQILRTIYKCWQLQWFSFVLRLQIITVRVTGSVPWNIDSRSKQRTSYQRSNCYSTAVNIMARFTVSCLSKLEDNGQRAAIAECCNLYACNENCTCTLHELSRSLQPCMSQNRRISRTFYS